MKKVSKDEFYEVIGQGDVISTITGDSKNGYTTLFELRGSRKLVGQKFDPLTYPPKKEFYLS